eukprot:scaffold781_cov132-Cylindrotheca_fusiformis.AAC.8
MPRSKRPRRLDKEESHVVIIGSGLAGLSAAISLEQAGFSHVSIFERDDSFERQKEGYGLTLTYNPKGPLASLGLLQQVANEDCPSRSHYLFRQDGSIMGYFGNAFSKHRGLGQRGNLRVPRKRLRKLLLDRLSHTIVHWGHTLIDYEWNQETNQYTVLFEKRSTDTLEDSCNISVTADLLVAADGIRSIVLKQVYANSRLAENNARAGLRPIGIRLILGIAEFSHPLLRERGFYTLDGKHRLFTMPFESNRFDKSKSNRIMWQLSLSNEDEDSDENEESNSKKNLDPISLRQYVLDTCDQWHDPVKAMVNSTPLETIWGRDLMDRDPRQVQRLIQEQQVRRLVAIGDALHSMSPFKGQGANQALKDGPLLAHWLQKASIDSAITSFWREVVQRTAPVVEASRRAARELHTKEVLHDNHEFAGLKPDCVTSFLSQLKNERVGANLGAKLDEAVQHVIEKRSDIVAVEESEQRVGAKEQLCALRFAAAGDLEGLRQLTLDKHWESIRVARDSEGRSCLHLAAQGGHALTCKWLLAEVECDASRVDNKGKTPMEYAAVDSSTFVMLQTMKS